MPKHGDGVTMQNLQIPHAHIFIRQYHKMNAQMTNGMISKKTHYPNDFLWESLPDKMSME